MAPVGPTGLLVPACEFIAPLCTGSGHIPRTNELTTSREQYPVYTNGPSFVLDLPNGVEFEYNYAIFSGGVFNVRASPLRACWPLSPCLFPCSCVTCSALRLCRPARSSRRVRRGRVGGLFLEVMASVLACPAVCPPSPSHRRSAHGNGDGE